MKKVYVIILVLTLVACSSSAEVSNEDIILPPTTVSSSDTPSTTIESEATQEPLVEEYIFDIERMSALTGLEILVAFLQAYVFAILTCIYLNDALNLHH